MQTIQIRSKCAVVAVLLAAGVGCGAGAGGEDVGSTSAQLTQAVGDAGTPRPPPSTEPPRSGGPEAGVDASFVPNTGDASTPKPDGGSDAGPPPCNPASVESYPSETSCCAAVVDGGAVVWSSCIVTYDGSEGIPPYQVWFSCETTPSATPLPGTIDDGDGGSTCSAGPQINICITSCYGCNTSQ